MKFLNLRIVLLTAFCGVAVLNVLWFPAGQETVMALDAEPEKPAKTLTIGSTAPALDVEYWVQDGNGFFKPVTEFKAGNVYVVEFWATWCGPCISSMPHLAELQDKLRGQNVQIVSISDEPLETVETFLKRETQNKAGEDTTFASITSAYSLTTDPDRSAHEDYMEAAKQPGIPTAFIVGKDGKVEWIGHPMEMDEPLDQVVAGTWDRAEFGEVFIAEQKLAETMQSLSRLANQGKFADAIAIVDTELAKKLPPKIQNQLVGVKHQLKLMGGMIDDEVAAFIRNRITSAKGNAIGVAQVAVQLMQLSQQNPAAVEQPAMKELITEAIAAVKGEVEGAEKAIQPLLLDITAHLQEAIGDLDGAIQSQEAAVAKAADERTKDRLSGYLEELKAAKNPPAEEPETK
jgi:thiol-disulfide isomerase/thioredoxin